MKENIVKEKSFSLAMEVIKTYKYLVENKKEFIMSKQLLRSGTAIGALIREAEHAESKADFIHKLAISLKEANESDYWIELLHQSNYLVTNEYESIQNKNLELIRLLTSIIKSTKANLKK
jgi:four helix bundle protein